MTKSTIRLPEDVYLQLKIDAARNRRSINSEILIRLEGALSAPSSAAEDRGAAA